MPCFTMGPVLKEAMIAVSMPMHHQPCIRGVPVTKTELIEKVSESSKISKKDVHAVIEGFLGAIEDSLKKGEKVALVGFGTFEVVKREARTGRNPQTGLALSIPAKTVPKFSAGKAFREAMNTTVKGSAPAKSQTSVKSTVSKKK